MEHMTESEKRLHGKKHHESKHHESKHSRHLVPNLSQGGLSGVHFVSHESQSAGHIFQPYPFNKGMESRLYGGMEHQIIHGIGHPHPVRMRSENLQKMIKSTVGNAYNLANVGHDKQVGKKHKDNTVKGSLLGFHSATQAERMGQVPYAGRFY